LKLYKAKHGDTDVPYRCADIKKLGYWVISQRTEYTTVDTTSAKELLNKVVMERPRIEQRSLRA